MPLNKLFILWILAGFASHVILALSYSVYHLRARMLKFEHSFDKTLLYENLLKRVLFGLAGLVASCFMLGLILVIPNSKIRNRERKVAAKRRHKIQQECNVPRIEVSAALDALANSDCPPEVHMKKVILFAQTLPSATIWQLDQGSPKKSRDSSIVTGHTPEHGNISTEVKDEEDVHHEPFGKHKARVGAFRIWMHFDDLIAFHHFWSSDIATAVPESSGGKRPDIFFIEFNLVTLKPICLAVAVPKVIFTIFGYSLCRDELDPLWGTLSDPRIHGGYSIYG